MTLVSSPTPDEQAAEERKGRIAALLRDHQIAAFNYAQSACDRCNEWMTHARYRKHLTDLLAADFEAALVVVREQLTGLADDLEARAASKAAYAAQQDQSRHYAARMAGLAEGLARAADIVRAALDAPPSPPTYTTEDGQDA